MKHGYRWLCALLWVAACHDDATRVIVVIAADSGIAEAATSLHVRVAQDGVPSLELNLSSPRWPRSVVLEPLSANAAETIQLRADALDADGHELATLRLTTRFVPSETRLASLRLTSGCGEVESPGDGLSQRVIAAVLPARPCSPWRTPTTIDSPAADDATTPVIGATGHGGAIAAWYEREDTTYNLNARRLLDGAWETPAVLDVTTRGAPAGPPLMAADRDGHAIVYYDGPQPDSMTIHASARRFDGEGWGDATTLFSKIYFRGGPRSPFFVGSRGGAALLIRTDDNGSFGYSASSSRFDKTRWDLQAVPIAGFPTTPCGAIDDSGSALAVWGADETDHGAEPPEPTRIVMRASRLANDAQNWGPSSVLETIRPSGTLNSDLLVAIQPDGQAGIATWSDTIRLRYSRYQLDTGWSSASDLGLESVLEQMAIDAAGHVIAIGRRASEIVAVRYDAATASWSDLGAIAAADGGGLGNLDLAIEPGGQAVAAWTQQGTSYREVWAVSYDPATGWGAASALEPEPHGDGTLPHVAIDEQGNAFAIWQQSDATRNDVRVSLRNYRPL